MLVCHLKDAVSKHYTVLRDEIPIAEVEFHNPEETGVIRIGDSIYTVANDKRWRAGERKLFSGEKLLATSLKPSLVKQSFVVEAPEMTFELLHAGLFVKKYQMRRDGKMLGEIARQGWASSSAQVAIDDAMPLHLQLFSFWLVVMLWHWDSGS